MTVTTTAPQRSRTTRIVAVLVVAAFVTVFNETLLTVALPTLTREFGVGATTAQWVTSGFLLTMAMVIPTTGFTLARFTARQVFLAALVLFSAGTLIAGAAPVFAVLLAGRVVQACGTAMVVPLLMTTIMRLVPPERRGATMGSITLVVAAAPAVGPTVGGVLLDGLGWRFLFLSVLPLALLVLVAGAVVLRVPSPTRAVALDVLSVGLCAVAFGGIVYGFATVSGGTNAAVPPWAPLAAGVVALAAFVARQVHLQPRDRALLDLRPFAEPRFRLAIGLAALVIMVLLGVASLLLPLYLQTGLRVTPSVAGLAVLPGGLLLALLGRPVGMLFDRVGPRFLLPPGALLICAAVWTFALVPGPSLSLVIAAHVVLTAGIGLMTTPLLACALGALPADLYSHGSAIMTTMQQVAGAAATAGLVTVATALSSGASATPDPQGLRGAFLVAGCVSVVAVAAAPYVSSPGRRRDRNCARAA